MPVMLPFDLQQVICEYAMDVASNDKFIFRAMCVCKLWAHFVCSKFYRDYEIKNYLGFVGFVRTIASRDTLLPYGEYIRNVDLSPVNRYGIDMRVHKMIRYCPNLVSLTLGHPSSVKPDTIRLMSKYCKNLRILHMGGLESFPFMLECDFGGLDSLTHVEIQMTPIDGQSLNTLPRTLMDVRLVKLDSLDHQSLVEFTTHRRRSLQTLVIDRCTLGSRSQQADIAQVVRPLAQLKRLELSGAQVDDRCLEDLFDIPLELDSFRLTHTHITDSTLYRFAAGRLKCRHLTIEHNPFVSEQAITSLPHYRRPQ
ncbi:predicted protein [Lichtheimia corymbifera JMRC:FSU:9682]|uniref:F-box domain-containing protein n=1 Tax=Lichtheimia corymbifera JMRC:FSU:9682 TaxID=1263082 RepID=A0A068S559_9FUNG|nr:predicted protein [Lichtheimia corymbifera JMRC:FSU:9682]